MRRALAIELLDAGRVLTTINNPALFMSVIRIRPVDRIEVSEWHHRLSFRLLFTKAGTKGYSDHSYVGNYAILWDEPEEAEDEADV